MPSAYFVVRATVADVAKRKAFDEWYAREHLPDAAKAFGVRKARRFWSITDPSLHEVRRSGRARPRHERRRAEDAGRRIRPLLARRDAHARDAGAGGGVRGVILQ